VTFNHASDGYALLAKLHQFEQDVLHRHRESTSTSTLRSPSRSGANDNANANAGHGHGHGHYHYHYLLVIDSISACLAPLLYGEGDGGVGAALLNEIHLVLKRISRLNGRGCERERVAVFVTNGMVSDHPQYDQNQNQNHDNNSSSGSGSGRKPALGEMWRASDVHIVLEPVGDVDVIMESSGRGLGDLKRVAMKRVAAHLKKDTSTTRVGAGSGAGSGSGSGQSQAGRRCEFGIGAAGIVDLDLTLTS
jgi:hypothetical protein